MTSIFDCILTEVMLFIFDKMKCRKIYELFIILSRRTYLGIRSSVEFKNVFMMKNDILDDLQNRKCRNVDQKCSRIRAEKKTKPQIFFKNLIYRPYHKLLPNF